MRKRALIIMAGVLMSTCIFAEAATSSVTQTGRGSRSTILHPYSCDFYGEVNIYADGNVFSNGDYYIQLRGSNAYMCTSNCYNVLKWGTPNDKNVVVDDSFNVVRGTTSYVDSASFTCYDGLLAPNAKVTIAY